jgi:hypothetical protein
MIRGEGIFIMALSARNQLRGTIEEIKIATSWLMWSSRLAKT